MKVVFYSLLLVLCVLKNASVYSQESIPFSEEEICSESISLMGKDLSLCNSFKSFTN